MLRTVEGSAAGRNADAEQDAAELALLREAAGALREGFALFDSSFRLRMCNHTYRNLACAVDAPAPEAGESAENLFLKSFNSGCFVFPEETDISALSTAVVDILRDGTREVELKRADGRIVSLTGSLTETGGFLVSALDVTTERKVAPPEHGERDRANAQLRDAVEALDEGIVLYDQDQRLVFANSRYAEMLGPHSCLLVPGVPMQVIVGEAVASGQISITRGPDGGIAGILRTLEGRGNLKIEVEVSDGTQREITLARLRDGGIVATAHDITEQRTSQARARQLLNDAIEGVDFGIALVGDDDRLVFANRKFRQLGDPNGNLLTAGKTMREIHAEAIRTGLFPLPPGAAPDALLDDLDQLIREAAKGFQIPNNHGSSLVGNVYETALQGRLFTIEDVTEQARAERLFTDAVARLPVGVAIEGPEGQFTHCNDAFAGPFNLTSKEILEYSDVERIALLAPQIATIKGIPVGDNAAEAFRQAVTLQRATLMPMEVTFKDGRHYVVERAFTENDGRVVVVTDVTALKRAETRSLEVLNDAIESLDEGLALFDTDLNFVMGNRKYFDLYFNNEPPPDGNENLVSLLNRLFDASVMLIPEGIAKKDYIDRLTGLVGTYRKNETVKLADGTILLASAHQTELDCYLLSFTDITEQRRAEEEQREADLLLRTIVEACPANFLVSRVEDGKIIYCPPASRERFGKIKSTLSFFMHPEDREKYLEALLPTGSLDDYRVQFRRADGSIMQGLTAARITDYKGEDVIVSSTRDISDQLAMQEELEKQREISHQNEKLSALGELLAGVAHELNNPLSIVVGYAQMLEGKLDDPVLSKRVDRIAQAADRSARIVKTFLAMARQKPARIEQCSLNDIVSIAQEIGGYGLRANGVQVVTDFDEALPPVAGDGDQLVQVFTNLIVNAEHALTPLGENGVLVLRSFHDVDNDHSVIEVRDNGPGIAKELQARIFEPFFTTKDVGEGTGVGLAFSHRIIDTHDGVLEVASGPDIGTSFFVRLRAKRPDTTQRPMTDAPAETLVKQRVLVIDDEPDVGELITDLLTEMGCETTLAPGAREALSLLSDNAFDIIISDFKMPGMNGEEFYAALQKSMPGYMDRIGFVTGDSMGKAVTHFLTESERPHIEKPISRTELEALVRQLGARENQP